MWLKSGCKESPEDMFEIIKSEYRGRDEFLPTKIRNARLVFMYFFYYIK